MVKLFHNLDMHPVSSVLVTTGFVLVNEGKWSTSNERVHIGRGQNICWMMLGFRKSSHIIYKVFICKGWI